VITSVGSVTSIASQVGTGSTFVVSNSPTITTPVIAQINDASANATLKLASIASAVNQVTIENSSTGNAVHVTATGTDASIGLHLAGKGATGYVNVQDSTDSTKRIMFNAAGGTTATRTMVSSTQTVDRILSLPDATDTIVGKATTDTLTNKTLTNQTVTNYTESVVAIGTVTTTNTISLTSGTVQTATLTASTACTFTMPTATAGKSFALYLKQAATTGNGTATFTSVKWTATPTMTATAGKLDIFSFVADGTNWYGSYSQGYTY